MEVDDLTEHFRPFAEDICKRRGLRLLTFDEFETHQSKLKRRWRAYSGPHRNNICARGCLGEATIDHFWWRLINQNLYYDDSIYVTLICETSPVDSKRYSFEIYEFCYNELVNES